MNYYEHEVRHNPIHGRFPSDPDTRARLDRVRSIEPYHVKSDPRSSMIGPVVALLVIGLCVMGIFYVLVYGV